VDGCVARGLAPVVTLNHFTSPHWFAARGGWLDPRAPDLFAGYVDRVIARFDDRIAYAVTLNEPNLPRLLAWAGLPERVRELERVTLSAASEKAGVARYRVANVVLPEEFDAIADGMAAGHRAARAAIKARRADLPVGLALAVADDRVAGDDPTVRDRKRTEVYGRWLELARDDDFVGVQNYERIWYDATGPVPPRPGAPRNHMGSAVDPESLGGAVRYVYGAARVPVLVTEHGLGTDDDTLRAGFIAPSLAGLLDAMADGVPVLGYCHWTLLDNFEWIFGYAFHYGLFAVDRTTFERAAKPSAAIYSAIARARALP
jgi:beta-glucosidase